MTFLRSGLGETFHSFDHLDDALLALAILVARRGHRNSQILRMSEQRMALGRIRRVAVEVKFNAHGTISV